MGSPYGFAGSRFSEPRDRGFRSMIWPSGAPVRGSSITVDLLEVNLLAMISRWARYPAKSVSLYCGGRWSTAFCVVSEATMDAHLSVMVLS